MERAALSLYSWFAININSTRKVYLFAGPGNNGGDGLALARILNENGYYVEVYYLFSKDYSADFQINLNRLMKQAISIPVMISKPEEFPTTEKDSIIVDALFGSGLSRPLEGLSSEVVIKINSSELPVISIDMPSGLFGEANPIPNQNSVIKATTTLTLQFPKISFFFADSSGFVGSWVVIPIGLHPDAISNMKTDYEVIDDDCLSVQVNKRDTYSHKGNYGHCLIVSGSYGMIGAAVLASNACLKAGAGLVTVHIPRSGNTILQCSVPEAIVDVDDNDWSFSSVTSLSKYSAIGIGPGLGKSHKSIAGFRELLRKAIQPLVIDADALNIIADNPEFFRLIPTNTVITPHPGEFDRLFGKHSSEYERLVKACNKAKELQIIIVLKGAYTRVVTPDGRILFNSTGNPGMATGGSGDVLTGIITSFLGQGNDPVSAAVSGVYVHGLAGDIASNQFGIESLTATCIINCLGKAFNNLHGTIC